MTDYNRTGSPTQAGRGISKQIRDEFALIETAVNSKANIASPTFIGTPAAPTAALGTSTTQLATTAFVAGTALAASLPAQTGNAKKFITTDGTNASWNYINLVRDERTSNTRLAVTDQSHFIDITSGTFSQTISTCSTLGADWFCYIRNSGTGDIVLTSVAAEPIDGLPTLRMYPGETRLIMCDGLALRTVVLSSFIRTFINSGTFNTPSGYRMFAGLLWGGGGAGVKSGGATEARGGSGGACHPFCIPSSFFAATETVTIGAGGTGSGGTGGNSTLGSLITAYGGGDGGGGLLSAGSSGLGGEPNAESSNGYHVNGGGNTGVTPTFSGENSYNGGAGGGGVDGLGSAGVGGNAYLGGAGGGAVSNAGVTKAGGTSILGGNGGASGDASSGTNGSQPGGGGGATRTGASSGQGGAGQLIIWGIV
jgi:hypothetical protein